MVENGDEDAQASAPDGAVTSQPASGATPADGGAAGPDDEPDLTEIIRAVRPAPVRRDVDPEDWASGRGSDDERYLRERPPHWQ